PPPPQSTTRIVSPRSRPAFRKCPALICSADQSLDASMPAIPLTVNGEPVNITADGDTPLLDVLRNHLGLVGTKFGCGQEQCGCCMVLVDGTPEKSCGKAISTIAGKTVLTIEGLGTPESPHPLQQAFLDEQAGQRGYCLSGILISAK